MLIHNNPFEHLGYIEKKSQKLFSVKVIHPKLCCRDKPSRLGTEIGFITNYGIYDIFNINTEWGQLEDGSWIMLSYTTKINEDENNE